MAALPDGKLVVAATLISYHWGAPQVMFARYGADGLPDPSFGGGTGMVRYDITGDEPMLVALAAQPDGKIVALGNQSETGQSGPGRTTCFSPFMMRLEEDGSLDEAFGDGGVVGRAAVDCSDSSYASGFALQPNGKIVVAGQRDNPLTWLPMLIRFNPDGTPDVNFQSSGPLPAQGCAALRDVAVLPNGSLLASGASLYADEVGREHHRAFVARYDASGALDPSFGAGGATTLPWDSSNARVALQSGGAIVVGFNALTIDPNQTICPEAFLARLRADGRLDSRFGRSGLLQLFGDGTYATLRGVAVQADGRILAAVVRWASVDDAFGPLFVVRASAAGAIDRSFGSRGVVGLAGGYSAPYYDNGNVTALTLAPSDALFVGAYRWDYVGGGFGNLVISRILASTGRAPAARRNLLARARSLSQQPVYVEAPSRARLSVSDR
jgi:uncharacterized delta-60 repeat protein